MIGKQKHDAIHKSYRKASKSKFHRSWEADPSVFYKFISSFEHKTPGRVTRKRIERNQEQTTNKNGLKRQDRGHKNDKDMRDAQGSGVAQVYLIQLQLRRLY